MKLNEDMRGLFYIVRGSYERKEPEVLCEDGEKRFLGGYNPITSEKEWYRVLDTQTRFCVYAGSSFNDAIKCIEHLIRRFKSAKKYFKWISEISSEDFYFVHYLGHAPFTPEQARNRAEGRQPRQSYAMKCLEAEIYNEYGHFYDEDISLAEDKAYDSLDMSSNISKTSRKMKKLVKKTVQKPVEKVVEEPKKTIKRAILRPKVKVATV